MAFMDGLKVMNNHDLYKQNEILFVTLLSQHFDNLFVICFETI